MKRYHVTYEIVTQESAEHGDTAEIGFIQPGAYHVPMDGIVGEPAGKIKDECAMTLREALELVGAPFCENNGDDRSFRECDERQNHHTGESELRTLHVPDDMPASSRKRIARICCGPR